MKKAIKYSGIIAATLLAASAINMPTATVKAETKTETDVKTNNKSNIETKSDTKDNISSETDSDIIDITKCKKNEDTDEYEVVPDRQIKDPVELTVKVDPQLMNDKTTTKESFYNGALTEYHVNLKVKYKDGLMWGDIDNFVKKHITVYDGLDPISNYDFGFERATEKTSTLVKLNEKRSTDILVYQGLKPNTWYHFVNSSVGLNEYFQPDDQGIDMVPTHSLVNRLSEHLNNASYNIYDDYLKTDSLGQFPGLTRSVSNPEKLNIDEEFCYKSSDNSPFIDFNVIITNDKDAIDVPTANKSNTNNKDSNTENNAKGNDSSIDTTNNNKSSDDTNDAQYSFDTDPDYNYTDIENNSVDVNSSSSSNPGVESDVKNNTSSSQKTVKNDQSQQNAATQNVTKTVKNSTTKKKIVVVRQSFVYNEKGKVVKTKDGKYLTINRFTLIKNVSKKIVTIKGHKFYQIGKHKYIRFSNTLPSSRVKRVIVKSKKIRTYDKKGRALSAYLGTKKTRWHFAFDGSVTIKGHKYYHLAGSKNVYFIAKDIKKFAVK